MKIFGFALCLAVTFGLGSFARADVESGPVAGEKVPVLKVFGLVGTAENKETEFAADRKDAPTVYLFVQTEHFSRPMARFIKTLDVDLGKTDEKAAVVAVWVGEKTAFEKNKEYLPRVQTSLKFEHTSLAAFEGEKSGPEGWGVNPDAHLTVVVANKGKVVKSFAFTSVNETDVKPVLAELKKAVGK
ncbi:MAG: hypothetical protein JWO38_1631 [Gemmataceae bacterium]|nr:hypothetical protein [Gemmataceae bacterium]